MNDDTRCCGTGTCLINAEDLCWCGQRWDGEKMCSPQAFAEEKAATPEAGADAQGSLVACQETSRT